MVVKRADNLDICSVVGLDCWMDMRMGKGQAALKDKK
jgi:hypothetical protein